MNASRVRAANLPQKEESMRRWTVWFLVCAMLVINVVGVGAEEAEIDPLQVDYILNF